MYRETSVQDVETRKIDCQRKCQEESCQQKRERKFEMKKLKCLRRYSAHVLEAGC